MEIKINNKTFLPKLNQVVGVVSQRCAVPILSCIRIDIENNKMWLTASNGDSTLKLKSDIISCDFDNKSFCVESADFSKALKNLGDIDVSITIDETNHLITCNYLNGHLSIPYKNADEYVTQSLNLKESTDISLDIQGLLQAMNSVSFAIANDELRPVMNSIHFDFFNDGMVLVASDGKKLAKYRDDKITTQEKDCSSFNLPSRSAEIVKRFLSMYSGNVSVKFNEGAAMIYCDDFLFSTTLIEGHFPRYNAVIPKTCNFSISVNRTRFTDALKRVSVMANAATNLTSLTLADDKLTINAEDIDYSRAAKETIDCEYAFTNPPFTIGFDATCLLQVVSCFSSDSVNIDFIDPTKACIVYDDDKEKYLVLLMPMRI